jgi:DegV family protein with EDD domain
MSFWIVTDSCCDLPKRYTDAQTQFMVIPLMYHMDGAFHESTGDPQALTAFYNYLRDGGASTTSQINEESWKSCLSALLDAGNDVLCVVFSSALSGTYAACQQAAAALAGQYPDRQLYTVDTLCASLGQGLIVDYAIQCRDRDHLSAEQTRDWLERHKLHIAQWFTVEDLKYLKRGGRVSATSAFIAGALKIKPILHVSDEGKLIAMEKVQGRKRSLRALVSHIKSTAVNIEQQTVFVSHGDCESEAQRVADLIRKELPVRDVMIAMIGPIIGAHAGPGTVAVFWYGSER